MKVTEYLLKIFKTEGVDHVFMVPGANVAPLMQALSESEEVHPIIACQEGGAAYMADGYARASDKFGVVFAISGPGITNALTGIATAFTDGIPIFAVSGDVMVEWEGRGAFQDASASGIHSMEIFKDVTSLQLSPKKPVQVQPYVNRLIRNMLSCSSRGPVHMALPGDIATSQVDFTEKKLAEVFYHSRFLDIEACDRVWDMLTGCTHVAILAGTGVLHSNATDDLIKFAERFSIPVATTLGGKGVFPEDHPLSLGILGWFATRHAVEGLASGNVDGLIVIGSRLTLLDTMGWDQKLQPKKVLILNDIISNSIFREFPLDLGVLGDAREFLRRLLQTADQRGRELESTNEKRKKWLQEIRSIGSRYYFPEAMTSDAIPIHPARAICDLRKVMPKNTMIFADVGAHSFTASHYWTAYGPRQFFTSIKYMAPMGWAIAAAIGAKIARPDLPCVVITGDGCMLMEGMEIQTAARYQLPILFLIINNSAYGISKYSAQKVSAKMAKGLELPTHDWVKFAESLGVIGMRVEKPEDLIATYEKAVSLNKTVVIDAICGVFATPTESFGERVTELMTGKKSVLEKSGQEKAPEFW